MNLRHIVSAAVVWLGTVLPTQAITLRCPADSVKVGNTCVDTYEASLWRIDPRTRRSSGRSRRDA